MGWVRVTPFESVLSETKSKFDGDGSESRLAASKTGHGRPEYMSTHEIVVQGIEIRFAV